MMKPPRKGAITKALAVLMESINEENGSQLAYEDTAAFDSASLETLAEVDNALGIAYCCLSQFINGLIADIRYRRNRAVPIHQIPVEVFTTIVIFLTSDYSPKEGERHMLNLMGVSRRWRDVILDSPELWTNIRSDHPPKRAKLIIERSKAHSLSLDWDTSQFHHLDSNSEEFKSMVELVTRNSSRLRSMEVTVGHGSQETLRRLLDCPKPRLEILYVNLCPLERDAVTRRFTLSEGSPLKELILDSAGLLDWDSPRLSGLRVLNLRNPSTIPSIDQILLILSTSPLLAQLRLWEFDSSAGIPSTQIEQPSRENPIELPHLKTLAIRNLPPSYCTSILSRIRPRLCEYVDVLDYEPSSANTMPGEELWRERSDTMVALLQLSKLSDPTPAENYRLSIWVTEREVFIHNSTQLGPHNSKAVFGHTDSHHAFEVLSEFFSGPDFKIPPLSLRLEMAPTWKHKQLDLRQWSCCLEILEVGGTHMARAVYEVLGQQLLLTDGTISWSCPRLSSISLFYGSQSYMDEGRETDDGMALLLAVQKRWSGEHEIPALPQPKQFSVWCREGIYASIQSRAEAIRSIIPSFQMKLA